MPTRDRIVENLARIFVQSQNYHGSLRLDASAPHVDHQTALVALLRQSNTYYRGLPVQPASPSDINAAAQSPNSAYHDLDLLVQQAGRTPTSEADLDALCAKFGMDDPVLRVAAKLEAQRRGYYAIPRPHEGEVDLSGRPMKRIPAMDVQARVEDAKNAAQVEEIAGVLRSWNITAALVQTHHGSFLPHAPAPEAEAPAPPTRRSLSASTPQPRGRRVSDLQAVANDGTPAYEGTGIELLD